MRGKTYSQKESKATILCEATPDAIIISASSRFQLTRPSRGRNIRLPFRGVGLQISTHTPLAGRNYTIKNVVEIIPISTHTPLAGRNHKKHNYGKGNRISTHTPLAGRNCTGCFLQFGQLNFNSHAPRGAQPYSNAL